MPWIRKNIENTGSFSVLISILMVLQLPVEEVLISLELF